MSYLDSIISDISYMSIPFEQKYKIFLIYFSGTKWKNCAVHICTVSDTLQRLGVGLPWYLFALVFGMVCSATCRAQSFRVRWGLGSPPAGYMERAGGGAVDTSRRKNSKKAFLLPTHPLFSAQNIPPPLPISKISRKNKKTPTKGLCSVLYLPYKP